MSVFLHNIITVKFFEDVIGQFVRKKTLSLLMQKQVSLVVCGLIIEHCALSGVLIPQKWYRAPTQAQDYVWESISHRNIQVK